VNSVIKLFCLARAKSEYMLLKQWGGRRIARTPKAAPQKLIYRPDFLENRSRQIRRLSGPEDPTRYWLIHFYSVLRHRPISY
jgi:hypothetical protein